MATGKTVEIIEQENKNFFDELQIFIHFNLDVKASNIFPFLNYVYYFAHLNFSYIGQFIH